MKKIKAYLMPIGYGRIFPRIAQVDLDLGNGYWRTYSLYLLA